MQALRGRDVLPLETESMLARREGAHGSYVQPEPPSLFTHAVQGRLPSHLWWGEVGSRPLDLTLNTRLTVFLRLTINERFPGQFHALPSEDCRMRLTDRRHTPDPCLGYFQRPSSSPNHTYNLRFPCSCIWHSAGWWSEHISLSDQQGVCWKIYIRVAVGKIGYPNRRWRWIYHFLSSVRVSIPGLISEQLCETESWGGGARSPTRLARSQRFSGHCRGKGAIHKVTADE